MRRLTLLLRFEPQATPDEGGPTSFTVKSGEGRITVLDGDPADAPDAASYESRVVMLGETTFDETGTFFFMDGGMRITTIGSGVMEPSAEEGALQGAVLWRVEGSGRYAGASGTVASSLVFEPERGAAVEHQVVRLFLP